MGSFDTKAPGPIGEAPGLPACVNNAHHPAHAFCGANAPLPTQIFPPSNLPLASPHVPAADIPSPRRSMSFESHPPSSSAAWSEPASQVCSSSPTNSCPSPNFHLAEAFSQGAPQLNARQACVSHTTFHPDRQTDRHGRQAGRWVSECGLLTHSFHGSTKHYIGALMMAALP